MKVMKYLWIAGVVSLVLAASFTTRRKPGVGSRRESWYSPWSYFKRATMDQPDRSKRFGQSHLAHMKLSKDGTKLYTLEQQGAFKIWDVQTQKLAGQHNHKYLSFRPDHFSVDGRRGIRISDVYDLESGKLLGTTPFADEKNNKLIGFSVDANQVWGVRENRLELYDFETKQTVKTVDLPEPHSDDRWERGLSPKRRYFAMVDKNEKLNVIDLIKNDSSPNSLDISVRSSTLLFSDDETALAIGGDRFGIRFFVVPDWVRPLELEVTDPQAKLGHPVFFSPQKSLLLVSHSSAAYRAYDSLTGKLKYPEFRLKTTSEGRVSPNGKWLVQYPEGDYNLVIYDLANGKKAREICPRYCYARKDSGPENLKYEFTADERSVFVMGFSTVALWPLSEVGQAKMFADPNLKAD